VLAALTVPGRSGSSRRRRATHTAATPAGTESVSTDPVAASAASPPRSRQAERERTRDTGLRRARTCYGHLAGVAGVALLDDLLRRGWLATEPGEKVRYGPTSAGAAALEEAGIELERLRGGRRAFACDCLDWTERRPHLGGALGVALFDALESDGYVRRLRPSRAVAVLRPPEDWTAAAAARTAG
jgi:hypothetical protein